MQFTKDTFYMTLRTRLAALNPQRTVTLEGALCPAVVVVEDEPATSAPPFTECFYLTFGAAQAVKTLEACRRPMFALACEIGYRTAGTSANLGVDRGRILAQLDLELLQICSPHSAPKQDFTATPAANLNTQILWEHPQLADAQTVGAELRRTAKTMIYFYPEMDLL